MRVLAVLALFGLLVVSVPAAVFARRSPPALIDASNIDAAFGELSDLALRQNFKAWSLQHQRDYPNAEIESERFAIFKQNVAAIEELRRQQPQVTFELNQFADMSDEEFAQKYLNFKPMLDVAGSMVRRNIPVVKPRRSVAAPETFDWRAPGSGKPVAVTPVKDQGACGSCWAFSAVETLESAFIMKGKPMTLLSEQQVVSCDQVDGGCNGGDLPSAYDYIQEAGGVQTEESYPYTSGTTSSTGQCKFNASAVVPGTKVLSYSYATPACFDSCKSQDEEKLKQSLLQEGPVAVCVHASVWKFYKTGVMDKSSGCKNEYPILNHCTQLTGYGVDAQTGVKYWNVRNSWSTGWGEQGYIRLKYGENTCGVADEAMLPQI